MLLLLQGVKEEMPSKTTGGSSEVLNLLPHPNQRQIGFWNNTTTPTNVVKEYTIGDTSSSHSHLLKRFDVLDNALNRQLLKPIIQLIRIPPTSLMSWLDEEKQQITMRTVSFSKSLFDFLAIEDIKCILLSRMASNLICRGSFGTVYRKTIYMIHDGNEIKLSTTSAHKQHSKLIRWQFCWGHHILVRCRGWKANPNLEVSAEVTYQSRV